MIPEQDTLRIVSKYVEGEAQGLGAITALVLIVTIICVTMVLARRR